MSCIEINLQTQNVFDTGPQSCLPKSFERCSPTRAHTLRLCNIDHVHCNFHHTTSCLANIVRRAVKGIVRYHSPNHTLTRNNSCTAQPHSEQSITAHQDFHLLTRGHRILPANKTRLLKSNFLRLIVTPDKREQDLRIGIVLPNALHCIRELIRLTH